MHPRPTRLVVGEAVGGREGLETFRHVHTVPLGTFMSNRRMKGICVLTESSGNGFSSFSAVTGG
jgi:hypothetical protein